MQFLSFIYFLIWIKIILWKSAEEELQLQGLCYVICYLRLER